MGRPDPALVQELKALLGDPKHSGAVAERVRAAGDAGLGALRAAAKGSKKREQVRLDALLLLGDAGAPAADGEVREVLRTQTHAGRDLLLQRLASERSRLRFAPELRAIAANAADPGWSWAVGTLGELRDAEAVPILMEHTCGVGTPFVLLAALVKLRDPIAALCFEPNLAHPEPRTRTLALWGLAALGYETPVAALVRLLDEPDARTPTSFSPGQARRAAQALCDVHDWPFEWAPGIEEETRERCRERYTADHLERCERALARGELTLAPGAGPERVTARPEVPGGRG